MCASFGGGSQTTTKATADADFSGVIGATGEYCEVRDPQTLGVCAEQVLIRDAGDSVHDVVTLFDSTRRHLAATDGFEKVTSELDKQTDGFAKVDAEHQDWIDGVAKRANDVTARLRALDYDAVLSQVDALLAAGSSTR